MTGIDRGLEVIGRAIDDPDASSIAAARQVLRNWHHRLDQMTVVDGRERLDVQDHMNALSDILATLTDRDPLLFTRQQSNARSRLDPQSAAGWSQWLVSMDSIDPLGRSR